MSPTRSGINSGILIISFVFIFPGTYLTSISINSPGCLSALIYLYLIFLTLYFLTNPSFFKIFPMVLSSITMPSFSNCQCILIAHFQVFFLISTIRSFSHIGVSILYVLGSVDLGSRPASPCLRYSASQRSRLLLPYGHTFATPTSATSLCIIGRIHLRRSSLIVLDIHIAIYPV